MTDDADNDPHDSPDTWFGLDRGAFRLLIRNQIKDILTFNNDEWGCLVDNLALLRETVQEEVARELSNPLTELYRHSDRRTREAASKTVLELNNILDRLKLDVQHPAQPGRAMRFAVVSGEPVQGSSRILLKSLDGTVAVPIKQSLRGDFVLMDAMRSPTSRFKDR